MSKALSAQALAQINAMQMQMSSMGVAMITPSNIVEMYQLVSLFADDPELYEEFKNNPAAVVAREIPGYNAPGSHFHTADRNNPYIPAEGDAENQLLLGEADPDKVWARIEIRTGIGPLCFFSCGVCVDQEPIEK